MNINDCDDFTQSYIETLIWSSEPDLSDWDGADASPELIERAHHECKTFQYRFECFFEIEGEHSQAGHDFALTRNGHGAGFWDGDWPIYGDMLTKGSESFGEVSVYLGDDGMLHS